MNKRTVSWALTLAVLAAGTAVWGAEPHAAPAPGTPATNAPALTNGIGPTIRFETMVHDFGRAKSGEVVKYIYAFTNIGDQVLEVTGVQACGCITADWTKRVEPGMTGAIPVAFNSAGYGGQLGKAITVTCNDRTNPRPVLQLTGTIWKPIDVIPSFAVLNLAPDAPSASASMRLTNNMADPVSVFSPESSNQAITAELTTNQPGKEFQLVIAAAAPLPSGRVSAQITLKTSSTNMPTISFPAYVFVQPAVTISPPEIALPPAPLAQAQTNTLNLINNSTNPVALSEPAVNAAGVEVQLKELVPGRNFTATLTFPQGFEIAAGQQVELGIKSSLRQMPTLKVPIRQTPRPVAPKVAAVTQLGSVTDTTNGPAPLPSIAPPR